MSVDEIYELFMWDESLTDEEYEKRVSAGINEAKRYKYLYPFIQPFIPVGKQKSLWGPCAEVIFSKSDAELKPYLYFLFEWIMDLNWPGALIIFDRLAEMQFSLIEEEYLCCRERAVKENDTVWLAVLDDLKKQMES